MLRISFPPLLIWEHSSHPHPLRSGTSQVPLVLCLGIVGKEGHPTRDLAIFQTQSLPNPLISTGCYPAFNCQPSSLYVAGEPKGSSLTEQFLRLVQVWRDQDWGQCQLGLVLCWVIFTPLCTSPSLLGPLYLMGANCLHQYRDVKVASMTKAGKWGLHHLAGLEDPAGSQTSAWSFSQEETWSLIDQMGWVTPQLILAPLLVGEESGITSVENNRYLGLATLFFP